MNLHILSPYQWKNQRNKAINEKTENQSYDFGCIMGYFDLNDYNKLNNRIGEIEDTDIYDNEEKEYGREVEPHVTILFGLHDDEIDEEEVIELLKSLRLPTVQLTQISSFDNEKFDVLKWDVESEQLNLYNKIVTLMFPYTSKFPDYHAHCTIAYLNPGAAKKYSNEIKEEIELPIIKWVYSMANGKKISIDEQGEVEVMREAKDKKEKELVEESYQQDESYDYKGYRIELHQNKKYRTTDDKQYSYMCRVLKNGEYQMGLKGPVSLTKAKEAAEYFINGTISKNNVKTSIK